MSVQRRAFRLEHIWKRGGTMRKRRRWGLWTLAVITLAGAGFLLFRQGVIPPKWSPLPVLDIDAPLPLVVDWQLVEVGTDRTMCRRMLRQSDTLKARLVRDKPLVDGCGWINAVRTASVAGVPFRSAHMTCPVAAALAMWVEHEVQPLAQRIFGSRVVRIGNFGVYNCRKMVGSRYWKNRMSEHASANAVDISSFRLANGTSISVKRDWSRPGRKSEFLRAVHLGACGYFRVALSPDFNAAHHDHFHFDRGLLSTCR